MSDPIESLIASEHAIQEDIYNKTMNAARAMERIEAAGERGFVWRVVQRGFYLGYGISGACKYVPWPAIRDDEQDPLLAAEQAAMEEMKDE